MTLPTPLPDGLILRRSTAADAERLAAFNAGIHNDETRPAPDETIAAWVRDLLLKPHPTFGEGDFTIVEDPATGQIVSSCSLISQTWAYAGAPFKVGRPELVGTDPAYRNRGLIRAQFDVLHRWSAERGELVQVITGIPYYYRLFGYEMAVDLSGGRLCHPWSLPKLKPDQSEPFRLRRATEADAQIFVACDRQIAARALLTVPRDEALWRYELAGRSANNVIGYNGLIIEGAEGEMAGAPVGALLIGNEVQGTRAWMPYLELLPGVSYLAAAASVLRLAWAEATAMLAARGRPLEALKYSLGADHPFYRVNGRRLSHVTRPYAWYIRVPDASAFLRTIAPVLEARLAASAAAHYTGALLLSFYRSGVRVSFERGRIMEIADWPPVEEQAHASFPGLTFTQLLFGHRSVDELAAAFPDFMLNEDDGRPLVEALFPRQGSRFLAVA